VVAPGLALQRLTTQSRPKTSSRSASTPPPGAGNRRRPRVPAGGLAVRPRPYLRKTVTTRHPLKGYSMIDKTDRPGAEIRRAERPAGRPGRLRGPRRLPKARQSHNDLSEIVGPVSRIQGNPAACRGHASAAAVRERRRNAPAGAGGARHAGGKAQQAERELPRPADAQGPEHEKDVLLEIRAGTGGNEATLLAADSSACIAVRERFDGVWNREREHLRVGGYKKSSR